MNQLEEIKLRWKSAPIGKDPVLVAVTARDDINWLTHIIDDIDKLGCATIAMQRDGLRELLRSLEWSGTTTWGDGAESESCPACGGIVDEGHTGDCKLAEVLCAES